MSRRYVWAVPAAAAVGLEAVALRRPDLVPTLSDTLRHVFRTDTDAGRAAFLGVLAGGTAWLAPHICRRVAAVVDDVMP